MKRNRLMQPINPQDHRLALHSLQTLSSALLRVAAKENAMQLLLCLKAFPWLSSNDACALCIMSLVYRPINPHPLTTQRGARPLAAQTRNQLYLPQLLQYPRGTRHSPAVQSKPSGLQTQRRCSYVWLQPPSPWHILNQLGSPKLRSSEQKSGQCDRQHAFYLSRHSLCPPAISLSAMTLTPRAHPSILKKDGPLNFQRSSQGLTRAGRSCVPSQDRRSRRWHDARKLFV